MISDDIRAALDKLIVEKSKHIIEQRASDYETYLTVYGELNGLRLARAEVDEAVRKANDGR